MRVRVRVRVRVRFREQLGLVLWLEGEEGGVAEDVVEPGRRREAREPRRDLSGPRAGCGPGRGVGPGPGPGLRHEAGTGLGLERCEETMSSNSLLLST